MDDGRRILASAYSFGFKELLFSNWEWSVRESTDEEGCVRDAVVTTNEAVEFFDSYLARENTLPAELGFQARFPETILFRTTAEADQSDSHEQAHAFDPRVGWELHIHVAEQGECDGDMPNWFNDAWLFGANGSYLLIEQLIMGAGDCPLEPTIRWLTASEAADWCYSKSRRPPPELHSAGTLRILNPCAKERTQSIDVPNLRGHSGERREQSAETNDATKDRLRNEKLPTDSEASENSYLASDVASFLSVSKQTVCGWRKKAPNFYPEAKRANASEWRTFVMKVWPNKKYDPEKIPLE